MIDIEKFLISLRNNKDLDGRLNPIRLAETVAEEVKIVQTAINAARRDWVGLTQEEIESCNQTTTDWGAPCVWLWDDALEEGGIQFARAIEAKLREKNA